MSYKIMDTGHCVAKDFETVEAAKIEADVYMAACDDVDELEIVDETTSAIVTIIERD